MDRGDASDDLDWSRSLASDWLLELLLLDPLPDPATATVLTLVADFDGTDALLAIDSRSDDSETPDRLRGSFKSFDDLLDRLLRHE